MISDVLFEAVSEIDRYLVEFPDVYSGARRLEVEHVRKLMNDLRATLDTPPDPAYWMGE